MKLTQVNIIGNVYRDCFSLQDVRAEEVTTKEKYESLVRPEKDGQVWSYSYTDHLYDSASGSLENGQFAQDGDSLIVKIAGHVQAGVTPKELDVQTGSIDNDIVKIWK